CEAVVSCAPGAVARLVLRRSLIGPRRSAGRAAKYSSTVVGSGMERILSRRASTRRGRDGQARRCGGWGFRQGEAGAARRRVREGARGGGRREPRLGPV